MISGVGVKTAVATDCSVSTGTAWVPAFASPEQATAKTGMRAAARAFFPPLAAINFPVFSSNLSVNLSRSGLVFAGASSLATLSFPTATLAASATCSGDESLAMAPTLSARA